MMTVLPANTTAPPDVAAARAIDSASPRLSLQLLAVLRDDEQRVVDPDAQPDHRRERGRDGRDLRDVADHA